MEVKNMLKQFNHKCKCCLEDGHLRDMWGHYYRDDGEEEVYGEMINKCFALAWQEPSEYTEQICTSCMKKLRAAFSFKKEVLTSEQIFLEHMEEDEDDVVEFVDSSTHENEEAQQDTLEALIKKKADIHQQAVYSELAERYFKAPDTTVTDKDDDCYAIEILENENSSGSEREMDKGNLKRKRNSTEQLHNIGREKKKKGETFQACIDALVKKPFVLLEKIAVDEETQSISEMYTEDDTITAEKDRDEASEINTHLEENDETSCETFVSESETEVNSLEDNPTNKKINLMEKSRNTVRTCYTEKTELRKGIETVLEKKMTIPVAAAHYDVPYNVLYYHVKKTGFYGSDNRWKRWRNRGRGSKPMHNRTMISEDMQVKRGPGRPRGRGRKSLPSYSKIMKTEDMEGKRDRSPMQSYSKKIMSEDMEGKRERRPIKSCSKKIMSEDLEGFLTVGNTTITKAKSQFEETVSDNEEILEKSYEIDDMITEREIRQKVQLDLERKHSQNTEEKIEILEKNVELSEKTNPTQMDNEFADCSDNEEEPKVVAPKNLATNENMKQSNNENDETSCETFVSESITEVNSLEDNPTNKKINLMEKSVISNTVRNRYTETELQKAIDTVLKKRMTIPIAAAHYSVPTSTLYYHAARNGFRGPGRGWKRWRGGGRGRKPMQSYNRTMMSENMQVKRGPGRPRGSGHKSSYSKIMKSEDVEGSLTVGNTTITKAKSQFEDTVSDNEEILEKSYEIVDMITERKIRQKVQLDLERKHSNTEEKSEILQKNVKLSEKTNPTEMDNEVADCSDNEEEPIVVAPKNLATNKNIKQSDNENDETSCESVVSESITEVNSLEDNPTNININLIEKSGIRNTVRNSYKEIELQRGIETVLKKRMTISVAAAHYNVPYKTLYYHVKKNGFRGSGKRWKRWRGGGRGRKPMQSYNRTMMSEDMQGYQTVGNTTITKAKSQTEDSVTENEEILEKSYEREIRQNVQLDLKRQHSQPNKMKANETRKRKIIKFLVIPQKKPLKTPEVINDNLYILEENLVLNEHSNPTETVNDTTVSSENKEKSKLKSSVKHRNAEEKIEILEEDVELSENTNPTEMDDEITDCLDNEKELKEVAPKNLATNENIKQFNNERLKHLCNIRTILLSSNATPIKCKSDGGYACSFCSNEYMDPTDLKRHTILEHDDDDKSVFMQGIEIHKFLVKLDITSLQCRICDLNISTLEDLIEHLIVVHYKTLHTDIKNLILPFKFESDTLMCCICGIDFGFFRTLSQHMNSHYRNYECDECGSAFVTRGSFYVHHRRHQVGVFPCSYCTVIFNNARDKSQHEKSIHLYGRLSYNCGLCGERFKNGDAKTKHLHEAHGVPLPTFNCNACEKTYNFNSALNKHIKNYHLNVKMSTVRRDNTHFKMLKQNLEFNENIQSTEIINKTLLSSENIEKTIVVTSREHGNTNENVDISEENLLLTETIPTEMYNEITVGLENREEPKEVEPRELMPHEKMKQYSIERQKLVDNIKTILLSSNATPIKCKSDSGYTCCFCTDGYMNPTDLKRHTIEEHDDDELSDFMSGIEIHKFLVKLDITSLKCKLCYADINTLEDLVEHLKIVHYKTVHAVEKNLILPFKFESDTLRCFMCGMEFSYFRTLVQHMNLHYKNYECDECGSSFVMKGSLYVHKRRHQRGVFPCTHCSRVFNNCVDKLQHENRVHRFGRLVYGCGLCGDKFRYSNAKAKHLHEVHGVQQPIFKCHACDRTFNFKATLSRHIKNYHLIIRKHKCAECEKEFFDKSHLRVHMIKHTKITTKRATNCM